MKTTDIPIHNWQGCYDGNWRGMITDEAFAHPAKYARGLIERIFDHGIERGWWNPGDVIGDPFGGIGTGGVTAAYRCLRWIGCELEPRFVAMAKDNFKLHKREWAALNKPTPQIVQGDSRKFAEIVAASGIVTSPPYAANEKSDYHLSDDGKTRRRDQDHPQGRGCFRGSETYGQTDGQIGALKSGNIDAVVSSPPYAETAVEKNSTGVDMRKQWENYRASGGGSSYEGFVAHQTKHSQGYGDSGGQIARLKYGNIEGVITSPPYAESVKGDHAEKETAEESREKRNTPGGSLGKSARHGGYGASDGNIGNLKEGVLDGAVTSPPYENSEVASACKSQNKNGRQATYKRAMGHNNYGETTPAQIGNESGETYWQAMCAVYQQCLISLKPGGYMTVVIKDYVKNKARVPLCDQTLQLLEHVGFEPVERIRAWLVKERTTMLLGGVEETKVTERKSFFRRLAEKKGSPRIDWEEVIIVRKPQ